MQDARFLIAKQKYLELLEAGKPSAALNVLRNELAPLNPELDHLHALSRFVLPSVYVSARLTYDCTPIVQSHDVL